MRNSLDYFIVVNCNRVILIIPMVLNPALKAYVNSVVLTVEYMKAHALPLKGIIFNHYHAGDTMEEDNIAMCRQMTGLPVLAAVRDDAEDIDIDPEVLAGLYDDIRLA